MLREQLTLTTTDGEILEAELVTPAEPVGGAVLTHPHPRHGGNMRSMVPGELIQTLPEAGFATLRFNFRGMGASSGSYSHGDEERLDVVTAVSTLHSIVEGLPLLVLGSSFGADTALCVDDPRIDGWCALAPPLRERKLPWMAAVASSERPKLLVVAERDKYRDPDDVRSVVGSWRSTSVSVVPGADHFFVGRLHLAIELATDWARAFISPASD